MATVVIYARYSSAELRDVRRKHSRLIDIMLEDETDDIVTDKLKAYKEREAELDNEIAEAERGVPVMTEDHVHFWLERIRKEKDPRTTLIEFVTRVTFDGRTASIDMLLGGSPNNVLVHHQGWTADYRRA